MPRAILCRVSDVEFDLQDQLDAVRETLLEGEQLYAVYDGKGRGTGFLGLTDVRVVLQDESYVGGNIALTSIPYKHVQSVSMVSNRSFLGGFVEASTLAIATSGHTYEVELRGHDKAKHAHDLILHFAARG